MADEFWAQVVAGIVAVLFVVVGRLVDRLLPDPEGKHPLPKPKPPTVDAEHRADDDT